MEDPKYYSKLKKLHSEDENVAVVLAVLLDQLQESVTVV
jgi:hypothetical protein